MNNLLDVSILQSVQNGRNLNVSFQVPAGVTVLFGPSGAGKSTCLSMIAGLIHPKNSKISYNSQFLTDTLNQIFVPPHERKIGFVFQSLALFPHMTAMENVLFGMSKGQPQEEDAFDWLKKMCVDHLGDRYISKLSGGEAQRVAIARALASSPNILLLDEPFSALDIPMRRSISRTLKSWILEKSIPTILVTHDVDIAKEIGDQVVLLDSGNQKAKGDLSLI